MNSKQHRLADLLDEAAHNTDLHDFLAVVEEALAFGRITTTADETIWTAEREGLTPGDVTRAARDALLRTRRAAVTDGRADDREAIDRFLARNHLEAWHEPTGREPHAPDREVIAVLGDEEATLDGTWSGSREASNLAVNVRGASTDSTEQWPDVERVVPRSHWPAPIYTGSSEYGGSDVPEGLEALVTAWVQERETEDKELGL